MLFRLILKNRAYQPFYIMAHTESSTVCRPFGVNRWGCSFVSGGNRFGGGELWKEAAGGNQSGAPPHTSRSCPLTTNKISISANLKSTAHHLGSSEEDGEEFIHCMKWGIEDFIVNWRIGINIVEEYLKWEDNNFIFIFQWPFTDFSALPI